jgi:large subunit ribosomal protein L9
MQLLLKRSVDKLGSVGDVVNVKAGFARNFLLPNGLGVPVTKANLAMIERERAKALVEEQARLKDLKGIADRIALSSITIEGRANTEGQLFGSVNAAQIAKALIEKGFPVEEKHIRLDAPFKQIGVFDVKVHLHQDLETTIKVWVVENKSGG